MPGKQIGETVSETMTGRTLVEKSLAVLRKYEDGVFENEHEKTLELLAKKGYLFELHGGPIMDAQGIGHRSFVIREPGKTRGHVCCLEPRAAGTDMTRYCCSEAVKPEAFEKIGTIARLAENGKSVSKADALACVSVMSSDKADAGLKRMALARLQEAGMIRTVTGGAVGKGDALDEDRPYTVRIGDQPGGVLFSLGGGSVRCMAKPMSERLYRRVLEAQVQKPLRPNAFFRFVNGVSKAFGGRGLKRCRDYDRAKMLYDRKIYNGVARAGYRVKKPRDVERWERRMLAAAYLAAYDKIRVPNTAHPFYRKLVNSRKFKKFVQSPAATAFLARAHRMTEQKGGVDMGEFIRNDADLLNDVKNVMDGKEPWKDWSKKTPEKTEPTQPAPAKTEPAEERKKPMTATERRNAAKVRRERTRTNEIAKTMEKLRFALPEADDRPFVDRMEAIMKASSGTHLAGILRDLTPESMIRLRDAWKADPTAAENSVRMMEHPEKVLMSNLSKNPQKAPVRQAPQNGLPMT